MNLIRSINKKMGSTVNRINVMANYAVIGIQDSYLEKKWNLILFSAKLFLSNFVYWVVQKWLYISQKKTIEDILDDKIK